MANIKERIKRFFYPFDEPLNIVIYGNNNRYPRETANVIKNSIKNNDPFYFNIKDFVIGHEENPEDSNKDLYFFKQPDGNVFFTVRVAEDIDAVYALKGECNIDLLIVVISFGDLLENVHDESDKYELQPIIEKSKRTGLNCLYVFNINSSIISDKFLQVEKELLCNNLYANMYQKNFSAASKYLNTKGKRQVFNIQQYQLGVFYKRWKRNKIKKKTIVLYNEDDKIVNTNTLLFEFCQRIFQLNKFANYTLLSN